MSIELWPAFVAASAVPLIIPGPTILTVISYSMARGRRAKLPLVAAVARLFPNIYLVPALNPTGIVFFVAFLPQFLNPSVNVTEQLWVLAVTFVVMATLNATLYAVSAASASRVLASPRVQRSFNLAGGSLLSVAGKWALYAKRIG